MLLPVKPAGVERQHSNLDREKPALWMAFIHQGMREYVASEVTQTEPSPDWKAKEEQGGG